MSKNQQYAERYAAEAMEQMKRYGIPASVTLAQGILESRNGQSELSQLGRLGLHPVSDIQHADIKRANTHRVCFIFIMPFPPHSSCLNSPYSYPEFLPSCP